MPGEIDTGGPRVLLHCIERPDCPISRSSSTVTFSSSNAHRSFTTIRHRTCSVVVGASHPECSTLHQSSVESTTIPGNDERNKFFRYERSTPVSSTSSNDLDLLASPRDRRGRKRSGEILQRYRARRRNFINDEMAERLRVDDDDDENNNENVPKIDEFNRENIVEGCAIDETRERTSTIPNEKERLSFAGTTACNLTRLTGEEQHRDRLVRESSAIVMRLFDGCGVEQEYQSMYPTNVKSSAANSSQRSRNRDISNDFIPSNLLRNDESMRDYRVDYECKCDDLREFKNCENSTSDRRKRPKNNRQKCRTYLQLALLMFLVAFGHNSLFKTRHTGFGGSSSISAGLSVITIGTIVRTVGALPVDLDAGVRAERSANLSHITGASRKIQMYIKNRHLQILPDGTVNGSNDDTSEYTIFQRASVSMGQLRIQGVATCLYLCMDSCGLLYGAREYTEDCVFNETLEEHNYNTYSSVRWSTAKKTLYLGLNRHGQPRRVQAKGHNLGRLSAYARVLTKVAPPDRVEALHSRMLGAQHNLRHHHNSHHHRNMQQTVCPNLPPQEKDGRDKFRCRKRKKRKKRKRPCNDGEKPGPHCEIEEDQASHRANAETSGEGPPQSKRSCEGAASEELCRKQALDAPAKKRKSRIETTKKHAGQKDNQQQEKQQKSSSRKDVKTRKNIGGKKSNLGGINAEEDLNKRVNGTNVKRKRPASKQRMALAKRRNNGGRVTRTTLPTNSAITTMTLPSTWYPGASTTSSSIDGSPRRRSKTSISPKNSVTSDTLKTYVSQSSRNGKALERSDLATETSSLEWSTENPDDHSALGQTFVEDLSGETSEEAKSDESTQEDDPTTSSSSEYSTLMTTMDTTPPERTEDYTRATTTESIHGSIEVNRGRTGIHNEDSTNAEHLRKLSRDLRLERLVM